MAFSSSSSMNAEEWLNCEVCGLTFKSEKHFSIHCGGTFHANRVAASLRASQNLVKTNTDSQAYGSNNNPSYWTGLQQTFPDIQQMEPQDKTQRMQSQPPAAARQSQPEYVSYPVGKHVKSAGVKAGDGYEELYGMPGFGWSDTRSGSGVVPNRSGFSDWQSELQQSTEGSSGAPKQDPWENSYYMSTGDASYAGREPVAKKLPEPANEASQMLDVPAWYKMIEPVVSNSQKTESYRSSGKPVSYGGDGMRYGGTSEKPAEWEDDRNIMGSGVDNSGKLRQLRKEPVERGKGSANRSQWETDEYMMRSVREQSRDGGDSRDHAGQFRESGSYRSSEFRESRADSDLRRRNEFERGRGDRKDVSRREDFYEDSYGKDPYFRRDDPNSRRESFAANLLDRQSLDRQRGDSGRREGPFDRSQSEFGYADKRDAKSGRYEEISSRDSARAEFERKLLQMQQNKGPAVPWEESQGDWSKRDFGGLGHDMASARSDWNGGGEVERGKVDAKTALSQRNAAYDAALGFAAIPSARDSSANQSRNLWNSGSGLVAGSVGTRPGQSAAWDDQRYSGDASSLQRRAEPLSAGDMTLAKRNEFQSAATAALPSGRGDVRSNNVPKGNESLRQNRARELEKRDHGNSGTVDSRSKRHSPSTSRNRLGNETTRKDQWQEDVRVPDRTGTFPGSDRSGRGRGQLISGARNLDSVVGNRDMGDRAVRGTLPGARRDGETSRERNSDVGVKSLLETVSAARRVSEPNPGLSDLAGASRADRGFPGATMQSGRDSSDVQSLKRIPGKDQASERFGLATGLSRGANSRPDSAARDQTRPLASEQKKLANDPTRKEVSDKPLGSKEVSAPALVQKNSASQRSIPSLVNMNPSLLPAAFTKGVRLPPGGVSNQKKEGQIKIQLRSKSSKDSTVSGKATEKPSDLGAEKPAEQTIHFVPGDSKSEAGKSQVPEKPVADTTVKEPKGPAKTTASVGQTTSTVTAANTPALSPNKSSSGGFGKPCTGIILTTSVTSTSPTDKTVSVCSSKPQTASILTTWASDMMAKSATDVGARPTSTSEKAALLPTPVSTPVVVTQAPETSARKALLPTPKLPEVPAKCNPLDPSSSRITVIGNGNSKTDGAKVLTKNLPIVKSSAVASGMIKTQAQAIPDCSPTKLDSKATPAAASSVSSATKIASTQSTKDLSATVSSADARPAAPSARPAPPAASRGAGARQEPCEKPNVPPMSVPGVQERGGGGKGGGKKESVENVDESDPALSEALGQFFSDDSTKENAVKSLISNKASPSGLSSTTTAVKPNDVGIGDLKKAVSIKSEPTSELLGVKSGDKYEKGDGIESKPASQPPPAVTLKPGTVVAKKAGDVSPSKSKLTQEELELEEKHGKDRRSDSDHDPILKLSRYLPPEVMKEITSGRPPKELLEKVADVLPADILLQAIEFLKNCDAVKEVRSPTAEASREASRSKPGNESGTRLQVVTPRKSLASPGKMDAGLRRSSVEQGCHETSALGKRKYDINISKLKDMSVEEMLGLFQELLQDILGSLFDEDQKSTSVDENKILDGLSSDDRNLALSVRKATGISDISKIVHTLNILKSLDAQTILALGQLDQSVIASSLSGNERAQEMGVTVLQQIMSLVAKENSVENATKRAQGSAGQAKYSTPTSSSAKLSSVKSLLSLDFSGPSVAPEIPRPAGMVRPVRLPANPGRGLLPTPMMPPQNSAPIRGQNFGTGLLPTPPRHAAIGNFRPPRPMKRMMPSSGGFFGAGPVPKRWR